MIDVKVRRTDAGCELRYLPQATEEDHGAHPFKCAAGLSPLTFAPAIAPFCFGDPPYSIPSGGGSYVKEFASSHHSARRANLVFGQAVRCGCRQTSEPEPNASAN